MKETKDIQYFLEAEKKFRKEHPDYGELSLMRSMGRVKSVTMILQAF